MSPRGKLDKKDGHKLMEVAKFLASSGILTTFTTTVTNINSPIIIFIAWNLFLVFIYLLMKDNTPKASKPQEDLPNAP